MSLYMRVPRSGTIKALHMWIPHLYTNKVPTHRSPSFRNNKVPTHGDPLYTNKVPTHGSPSFRNNKVPTHGDPLYTTSVPGRYTIRMQATYLNNSRSILPNIWGAEQNFLMETFANFTIVPKYCYELLSPRSSDEAVLHTSTLSLSVGRGTGRGFNRIASGKEFDCDEFSIWLEISPAF